MTRRRSSQVCIRTSQSLQRSVLFATSHRRVPALSAVSTPARVIKESIKSIKSFHPRSLTSRAITARLGHRSRRVHALRLGHVHARPVARPARPLPRRPIRVREIHASRRPRRRLFHAFDARVRSRRRSSSRPRVRARARRRRRRQGKHDRSSAHVSREVPTLYPRRDARRDAARESLAFNHPRTPCASENERARPG